VQIILKNDRIRLVKAEVGFTDACYNYRWRGTIFSFTLGFRDGRVQTQYVAWHPSSGFCPKSADNLSIVRLEHRNNSDNRGQTYSP
jgi:hypothetical protein